MSFTVKDNLSGLFKIIQNKSMVRQRNNSIGKKENFIFFVSLVGFVFLILSPVQAHAQNVTVPNPIAVEPANLRNATVIDIVFVGFGGFAALFGVLAFGFMLVNAFKLVVSAGKEEAVTKSKQGFTWSAISFFIALFSFSIISAVFNVFGGKNYDNLDPGSIDTIVSPIEETNFLGVFNAFLKGLTGVTALATAIMIVVSGIMMVTARGNEEQITKAKTFLKWAVVGLVLMVLAYAILSGINNLFSG
ncbi:MAG: hypothetical protein COT91_04350 [Candidatus Doudnabacteria bacterium CG10_big_fil_rev_8_21_14_0_10_41_10]|uniref:Uncharacterized protein n=1 Tax=Candidatus Doudnabacteria bacterium CG10_big_fil_rev_8_21_14_0_10_41_10 TaxID=1974551 RepID=A0A2H0VCP4_9BACT|nr:MAG: hypothetical protein COT91_04350 [Candidatus Doudnabacteria bacterium CG10_big_fil_rev_8_21_14_0_10_41_10]